MRRQPSSSVLSSFGAVALFLAGAAWAEPTSYSFVRTLDGSAAITSGTGEREEAALNQPLRTADRVSVAPRARLELVFADHNVVRLDGGTELALQALAFSGDGEARATRLELLSGIAQIAVTQEALGDQLPQIDSPNASIYLQEPGEYRLATDGSSWTEVVVRNGYAEVATQRGSIVVRAGESAIVEGARWASAHLAPAPPEDGLERWARRLEAEGDSTVSQHVQPELAYSAAPLARYGSWVSIEGESAWQPTSVEADWRPYWRGRWSSTPSGLTWVSGDPWGWVPDHYGTWASAPGYGWVWYPGAVYSPAWVYWHWSDGWAGWCPIGYYTRFYGRHHPEIGFHFGVYGWAGGSWDLYSDWIFSPFDALFGRRGGHFRHGGTDLARELGGSGPPRGILTTDTRGLDRARLRGGNPIDGILRGARPGGRFGGPGERLTDVTDFVARRTALPTDLKRQVEVDPRGNAQLRGTPLAPAYRGEPTARPSPGWRQERPGQGRTVIDRTGNANRPEAAARIEAGVAPADHQGWRRQAVPSLPGGAGSVLADRRYVGRNRELLPASQNPAISERRSDQRAPRQGTTWQGPGNGGSRSFETRSYLPSNPVRRILDGVRQPQSFTPRRPAAVPHGAPPQGNNNHGGSGQAGSHGSAPAQGSKPPHPHGG